MLLGLRTCIYPVTDIQAGKQWYSTILGAPPYFDEAYYVGFSVGGFELGLIPDGKPGADGSQALWGVDDIAATLENLLSHGAQALEAVTDVGGGIQVTAVLDPFGNRIGLIHNPHFDPKNVR